MVSAIKVVMTGYVCVYRVIFADMYSILETVGDARAIENIFTYEGCDAGVEWQYR